MPPHSGSMGGDAASAATDIEKFPVAERGGKYRECESVPTLVGLEAALGVQAIRWNSRYGNHRSRNLESVRSMGIFSLKQDRAGNGTVYSPMIISRPGTHRTHCHGGGE